MHPFELGAFFFGGVELDDAGAGPPAPMDRRISNDQTWKATTDYVSSAVEAERLGYDSFWTTEHHFQHEGYEVIPNGIQLSTWIAAHTSRIRLGTMFNVVPQWNPLRLAEDFSTLHNLSGGRGILGVGAAPCPARCSTSTTRGSRSARTTTPTRPPTTTATGASSRSRWTSCGWRSPTRRSPTRASSSSCRCPASPIAAAPSST